MTLDRFERLRAQALALLAQGGVPAPDLPHDVHALIEEMHILQAELEVQTEELRRSQVAAETARQHYFSVFENAPAGLLLLDSELRVRERNRRARELIGADPQTQPFAQYIDAESAPTWQRALAQVRDGEALSVEVKIRQVGGMRFFAQASVSPWRDAGEAEPGFLVGILDVTPLRTAEREQHALAHRYRTLFESARDGLVVIDDHTKTVVEANGAFCSLVRRPFEHLVGSYLERLFPPDRAVLYRLMVEQLPDHLASPPAEIGILDAEGKEIAVDVTVGRRENPPALLVQVRDASQRRALEHQRELAREAVHKNEKLEAVGRVAGSVAHELNNVLTAVSSIAASLEGADSLMEAMGAADDLLKTIERGRELTRGLLALTGRNSARRERFSMAETLLDVQRQARPTFPTGVGFTLDLDVGGDVELMGDPGLWRQALSSLVISAREAVGGEGKVRIRLAADRENVSIEIADDGRVASAQEEADAFEPFVTAQRRGVPGLGLALVAAVVRMHHAQMRIEPLPLKGKVVRIVVPRLPVAPNADDGVEDVGPVLVVDDDDDVRRAVVRMLRKRGFDVLEAGSAEAALERARADALGMVVSDLNMPGGDGIWLCRALRAAKVDVPVLITSGLADEELKQQLAALGAGLVEKPFSADELVASIRRARAN
jgi:two-component system cell cycle sensor histidine kinase/response regulator CckA